jgi:hypothetical protein
MACALFLMFYTHLNIATLSYYTLAVQLFLISMLLIYHYYSSEKKGQLILAGILFALSVLSLPTMAVAYLAAVLTGGIILLLIKKQKLRESTVSLIEKARLSDVIRYTFAGILIPATAFIIYLLLTVPVREFIRAIPYVLSDEEHGTSLIYPLRKFFISINEVFGYGAYAAYLLIMIAAASTFIKLNRNRIFRFLLFIADISLFVYLYLISVSHTGYIQTVVCLFTLPLFFLMEKKDLKLFFTFIVSGMIFSLVYSYSSNGYLYVLSMGHFIVSIGCAIVLEQFTREALGRNPFVVKYLYLICCTAVICISVTQTMLLRLVNIYRDAPVQMLDFRINEGPAKGLYTTSDHYLAYNVVYATLHKYCTSDALADASSGSTEVNGTLFITKLLPWGYMCTDLKCGAPTTWRTAFNSERLKPYYDINPDKVPDIILVMKESYGSYLTCGDVVADPSPNENEIGGWLLDYVNDNGYEKKTVPCGELYIKNR